MPTITNRQIIKHITRKVFLKFIQFTPDFNSFANDEYVPNFGNKIISQNNNINDKLGFKNIGFNDPRLIYHSPSPLILKKQDSKIIEENKNVDNQIDFDDPKNC